MLLRTHLTGQEADQADSEEDGSDQHVRAVETRRHVEGRTIQVTAIGHREGKAGFGIFDNLQCREAGAQHDREDQSGDGALAVIMLQGMVSPGDRGAGEQQDQRVHQRDVPRIEGLDAGRRPGRERRVHADLVEDGVFEEGPEPGHEEHDFRGNEQDHAIAHADIDNSGMIALLGLFDHVTPPADHRVNDQGEAEDQAAPGSVRIHEGKRVIGANKAGHVADSADSQKKGAHGAHKRPRARVNQVVVVFGSMPSHRESPAISNQRSVPLIRGAPERFNAKARRRRWPTPRLGTQKTYRTV